MKELQTCKDCWSRNWQSNLWLSVQRLVSIDGRHYRTGSDSHTVVVCITGGVLNVCEVPQFLRESKGAPSENGPIWGQGDMYLATETRVWHVVVSPLILLCRSWANVSVSGHRPDSVHVVKYWGASPLNPSSYSTLMCTHCKSIAVSPARTWTVFKGLLLFFQQCQGISSVL